MKNILLILLNAALAPVYAVVYLTAFALTWIPLFPCRVGVKNLRRHMNCGFFSSRLSLAVVFFHYFLYLVEAAIIWPLGLTTFENLNETLVFLKSMEAKYNLKEKQRGFVLVGGHFGNIEALGQAISSLIEDGLHHQRMVALAQPSRVKIITEITIWYRSRRRIRTELTSARRMVPTMKRLAQKGVTLALLIDQKPKRDGVFINFFGAPSAFPWRGLELLLEQGCPALHCTMVRVIPGRFKIVCSEAQNIHLNEYDGPKEINTNVLHTPPEVSRNTAAVLGAFVQWFEIVIKNNPRQYSWDYNNWSRNLPT